MLGFNFYKQVFSFEDYLWNAFSITLFSCAMQKSGLWSYFESLLVPRLLFFFTFSTVDYATKIWNCPFCGQRNSFPANYRDNISETSLPYELMPAYTTVEYENISQQMVSPVFLLLIDTTVDAKELNSLKDSLQQNLSYLPDNALVGIITFGTHVEVHELSTSEISRSYVFNGKNEYPTSKVTDMLGLRGMVTQSQVRFHIYSSCIDWCYQCCFSFHHASW